MIHVTDSAQAHLRSLLDSRNATPSQGLRLFVDKGGCAGWQYGMKITDAEKDDHIFEEGGVKVFVDAASFPLLDGLNIDFSDDLNDSGFKMRNPQAVRSCGCGTSFETAAATGDSAYSLRSGNSQISTGPEAEICPPRTLN